MPNLKRHFTTFAQNHFTELLVAGFVTSPTALFTKKKLLLQKNILKLIKKKAIIYQYSTYSSTFLPILSVYQDWVFFVKKVIFFYFLKNKVNI